jgi:tetratricopeptide (TPR) repeat protein
MPLLSELREFKASFVNVGGQKANLAAKKIPLNDLKLPETEAEPMVDAGPMAQEESAAEAPGFDTAKGIDDLDFSSLIGALPGDLSVPDIDDQPASAGPLADQPTGSPADDKASPGAEDLYFPDELLSNLSEEIEPVSATVDPVGSDNGSNLENLDNLENFNFPVDAAEPESANADVPPEAPDGSLDLSVFDDLGDFADLSDSSGPTDSGDLSASGGLSTSGGLGLPEEPVAAEAGESPAMDLGTLDDLGDLGLPEEPAAAEAGESPAMDLGTLDDLGDLGLPEEPAAAEAGESPVMDLGSLDDLGDLGLPEESAAAEAGESPAMDLGTLDDLGDLGLPEEPAAEAGESPAMDLGTLDDLGDLGLPEESAAAEAGESPAMDLGTLDDLGDLGLPEEPAAASGGDSEMPEVGEFDDFADLDLPEAPAAVSDGEATDSGDFADLDLPEEPAAASGGDSEMPEVGELDDLDVMDASSDFDLPAAPAAADAEESSDVDLGEISLPDEPEETEDEAPPDMGLGNLDEQLSVDGLVDSASKDAFEGFDPSGGVGWEKETGEAAADNIDTLDDIDDMSFPDLDNIVGESPKDKKAPDVKTDKAARKKRKKKAEIAFPEDEKDIELNDSELRYLQETLAGYPLNLRIACEEIIAEKDVRPEQMVRLLRNLIRGAPARETAALASEILDRPIIIPRGFEKSSVEALEAEKGTLAYIFVHNFLPVMRLVTLIAIVAACIFFLTYKFVYVPLVAESIYKMGYERIPEGEYERANERFNEAFKKHPKKIWFFKYADAFIKERQYIYAEQKYEELLREYPRDKLGVLYYAQLETKYLRNYAKADTLLRQQILDYNPNDPDALLALGDNSLAWGEIDPSKYEDARFSYARLMDILGQQPFIMERMMKYFIRTDNLKEVLPIWQWFDFNPKDRPLGAETLAELGGYLLDKQLEEVKGVPNEYVAFIEDVREILLRAVKQDPSLPEPHYHLARYYKNLGNTHEERVTLEIAIDRFEKAEEGSLRRLTSRIDAHQRYADNLIDSREFLHAEEQLQKGINLYDDAVKRRLLPEHSQQNGRLYAGLGDLEYFVKTGDMEAALRYYNEAQQNGWAPPDMRYRMGVAYYQLENWQNALENFFAASQNLPQNRRILFALGNAALKRGDYFVAQGYYNRLLDILENHRSRLPLLLPNDRPEFLDLAERLMKARNNAGVANEMLAARTGNRVYHTRAMALYSEAQRAWDSHTRDPRSMVRSGSTSLPFLNMRNVLYPRQGYEPQMFMPIDREASESSRWEQLAPAFKD